MRRILHILIALCLPTIVAAQGVRFDQYNMTSSNAVPFGAQAPIYTLPNSKVTVCAYPDDGGQPCGNVIPIYSDPALTQVADNPITADVHGRFGFWLAPGTYTYSVVTQGGQFVGTYIFTLGGTGGGSGCTTGGITAGDVLFPLSDGTCAGSDNIQVNAVTGGANGADTLILKTPSSQTGDVYNLLIDSAVDPSHNELAIGPHDIHMKCTNSGDSTLGCYLHIEASDSGRPTSSTGGLNPIWIQMDATQGGSHPGYIGMSIEQSLHPGVGTITQGMTGINIAGPVNNFSDTVANYLGVSSSVHGAGEARGHEYAYVSHIGAGSPTIDADACAVAWDTNTTGTPAVTGKLGCGSTSANTFIGPVAAPIYQETLTTPASSSAACTAGQFTDDANFHYVCVATNTWKRVALSTF